MTAACPRRRPCLDLSRARALAAALALVACSYSPNIESGSLVCSQKGECPRGFSCASSGPSAGRCISSSETTGTGGAGGSRGTGGASGDAGVPSTSAASYIGTWVFDSAASVSNDCGPGYTPQTTSLAGATLQIYATSKGADILGATWSAWSPSDCAYELFLDELGVHLNDSSWSCQDTTEDPAAYWQVESFEVVTSNGLTATHDAQYDRNYLYADGTTLYCTQAVHAVMNRR